MGRNTIRGPQGEQGVLVPTYLFDGSDWTKYLTYPLIEGFGKPIQNGLIITHNRTSVRHTHARHDMQGHESRKSHWQAPPIFKPTSFLGGQKKKKRKKRITLGRKCLRGSSPLSVFILPFRFPIIVVTSDPRANFPARSRRGRKGFDRARRFLDSISRPDITS
jgi:hypothetical protein